MPNWIVSNCHYELYLKHNKTTISQYILTDHYEMQVLHGMNEKDDETIKVGIHKCV